MVVRRVLGISAILTACVCFSGCGDENPLGRLAVSGTVTLDGAPLDQGAISFEPQQVEGSAVNSGTTIKDGK